MFGKIFLIIRNRFNTFIEDRNDFNESFGFVEQLAEKSFITISKNCVEYRSQQKSWSRIFLVLMAKLASILTMLRFCVSMLYNKQSVREYLFEFSNMIGPFPLTQMAFVTMVGSIIAVGMTIAYQELTKTFYLLDVFYLIKTSQIQYPLNTNNSRKLNIKSYFIARYLMKISVNLLVSLFSLIYLFLSLVFYLTLEEKFYSFIRLLLINILWAIHMVQSFAIIWIGFTIWYMASNYLKYKYREINDKIELSLKYKNINLLMTAIKEHNYVEILTKRWNHFFRVMTFIIYYMATIAYQLSLYMTHHKDTGVIGRTFAMILFMTCFSAMILMNAMSAGVISSAHKSYSRIHPILNKRMSFRQRWKILSFIEKLSGPPIGFYCYDLFPMNSYEFYQYLSIAGCNSGVGKGGGYSQNTPPP